MSEINKILVDAFLTRFDTPQQLKDWCLTYLDVDFPFGHIDPDSNSSPIEWMFEAYTNYRFNKGNETPGYIVLSSRESYKTWTESAFAIIMMCHFGCTIAHMAAVASQSSKAVEYISSFIVKVRPYLELNGRSIDSQNKTRVEIINDRGDRAFVQVIIATMQGANSQHTNIMSIDEVDVMRFPKAYEEAKMIPGVFGSQFPLTIKTSTRKFAFGLMEKEIQKAPEASEKVLRWNLIDVTEQCPPSRHKPDQPKELRWIHKDLPLRNLSQAEFDELRDEQRQGFSAIEAHAGCASCKLLPVCKTRLADRPDTDRGGLYKPIDFTLNQFKKLSPDMAEAQLMCWKPSSAGLIYKRFDETEVSGNTLTIEQAYEAFTGQPARGKITLKTLTEALINKGIKFKSGLDWGFRHYFAMPVFAQLPNGDVWIIDCYALPELELEDKIKYGNMVMEDYQNVRFYPDNSDPASIKSWRRRVGPCVDFKKDVKGGIEAIRALIQDGSGRRKLKVIKHERTEMVIGMFRNHHWKLDPAGNPTMEPDDEEYADIADAVRYVGQNIVGKSKAVSPSMNVGNVPTPAYNPDAQYQSWMSEKIRQMAAGDSAGTRGKSKGGNIIWDFTGSEPVEDDE